MIVRIVGEGQFRLSNALLDELNEMDNRIVQVVAQGDLAAYGEAFAQFLNLVHQRGQPLAEDDLQPSDVDRRVRALADVCLVLLNTNEFVYVY